MLASIRITDSKMSHYNLLKKKPQKQKDCTLKSFYILHFILIVIHPFQIQYAKFQGQNKKYTFLESLAKKKKNTTTT